jgi:hypothetical protein
MLLLNACLLLLFPYDSVQELLDTPSYVWEIMTRLVETRIIESTRKWQWKDEIRKENKKEKCN